MDGGSTHLHFLPKPKKSLTRRAPGTKGHTPLFPLQSSKPSLGFQTLDLFPLGGLSWLRN